MRKTFCDRCGGECTNTTGHIGGFIEHTTSDGQQVGADDIKQADLCKDCTDVAIEFLGLTIRPQEMEKPLSNAGGWLDIGVTDD